MPRFRAAWRVHDLYLCTVGHPKFTFATQPTWGVRCTQAERFRTGANAKCIKHMHMMRLRPQNKHLFLSPSHFNERLCLAVVRTDPALLLSCTHCLLIGDTCLEEIHSLAIGQQNEQLSNHSIQSAAFYSISYAIYNNRRSGSPSLWPRGPCRCSQVSIDLYSCQWL